MTERYLEDFAAGQTFGSGRLRVEEERIKTFAAEFDPQPFHLDDEAARGSIFGGLAASGWHTAALTMRLLVEGELKPAGGIVGVGFDVAPESGMEPGEDRDQKPGRQGGTGVGRESHRAASPRVVIPAR